MTYVLGACEGTHAKDTIKLLQPQLKQDEPPLFVRTQHKHVSQQLRYWLQSVIESLDNSRQG